MGAYSAIKETVFTGATGREIRRHPAEVREVQFWLLAGPGREPFGIFIFEPEIVAPQVGRPAKKVRDGLQVLVDLGFCHYDDDTQFVWVTEMAHHQFQTPLKAVDFRCKTAQKWYAAAPRNPFLGAWFDRYVDDFHLTKGDHAVERREWAPREARPDAPSDAPSMGLVLSCTEVSDSVSLVQPAALFDTKAPPDPSAALKGGALDVAFERIWTAHPHAVERKEARAQFGRLKPTAALVDTMLVAIEAQKLGDTWQRGYIPKLANWLKDHRWHDKVKVVGGTQPQLTDRNAKNLGAGQRFLDRRRQGGPQ